MHPHPEPGTANLEPRTANLAPTRPYTPEEEQYLHDTVRARGFVPGEVPRPASVTDQDIIARVHACRRYYHLRQIHPVYGEDGALVAIHERPRDPEFQFTPPPPPDPETNSKLKADSSASLRNDNNEVAR